MEKLRVKYPIIVEGRYDKAKLSSLVEGDILQNAPLLEALRRGTGEILAGGEESALLREASGVYMLSATSREAAEEIARQTGSDVVQVIGSRFVLYRRKKKDPKIVLPR